MVEAQTSVPYAIVGGILALLVFLIICVLVGMVWCSVRQKGESGWCLNSATGMVGCGIWKGAPKAKTPKARRQVFSPGLKRVRR